jgi:hypothetical protein
LLPPEALQISRQIWGHDGPDEDEDDDEPVDARDAVTGEKIAARIEPAERAITIAKPKPQPIAKPKPEPLTDEDIAIIPKIMAMFERLSAAGKDEAARRIEQRHEQLHGEIMF